MTGPADAQPRITPGTRRETGLLGWGISHVAGAVARTEPPNLFRTMARQPKLFRGWLRFAGRLMPGGTLPRRESELLILRVAHLRQCTYEFEHHVRLGRRAGVTTADVERVQAGPAAAGWSPRETVLLRAAEYLVHDRALSDDMWRALREQLNEAETIEFLLLVGHYDMLATFLLTLRVEPDRHR
ncbi:MAG: carboxymuconolactone decarboxylase family protein [Jatrophihabitans sp.]